MTSIKLDSRIKALMLSAMIALGGFALTGCSEEVEPTSSPEPDTEEPMGQGPMSNEGSATDETLDDDL
jgi:PBP1b-binding outer membrane lipoprotein LpoB